MKDINTIKKFFSKPLEEASSTEKFIRKLGWAGEDWTPQEFASQIKKLSDSTLIAWAKSNKGIGKGIPNTPLAFQQKLVKIEMDKRGLSLEESKEDAQEDMAANESAITEKVDMAELENTLKRVKKENPGKKVGYIFVQDAPNGYKISIDGKYTNESFNEGSITAPEWNSMDIKYNMNEAKSEDPVDTITMDIPLFLRMLEYAKEDAQEDMDLHDVTEKANTLGKEKGILTMEDYDAIVGAAEEINEGMGNEIGDKVYFRGDMGEKYPSSQGYYGIIEDTTPSRNYNMMATYDVVVYDKNDNEIRTITTDWTNLTNKKVNEASDYFKRRKAQDDYAVSKQDKPKKPYNPNSSGKTDYMKLRKKELAEAVFAKLKK